MTAAAAATQTAATIGCGTGADSNDASGSRAECTNAAGRNSCASESGDAGIRSETVHVEEAACSRGEDGCGGGRETAGSIGKPGSRWRGRQQSTYHWNKRLRAVDVTVSSDSTYCSGQQRGVKMQLATQVNTASLAPCAAVLAASAAPAPKRWGEHAYKLASSTSSKRYHTDDSMEVCAVQGGGGVPDAQGGAGAEPLAPVRAGKQMCGGRRNYAESSDDDFSGPRRDEDSGGDDALLGEDAAVTTPVTMKTCFEVFVGLCASWLRWSMCDKCRHARAEESMRQVQRQ